MNLLFKHRKVFITFSLLLLFLTFFRVNTKAYTADPSSGTYSPNTSYTVTIPAEPHVANALGVEVWIDVSNATVTAATPATGNNWGAIYVPRCNSNSSTFTSSQVCFGHVKSSGSITAGESIGTITFTTGSSGTVTLTRTTSGLYENTSGQTNVTQSVIGTYTIISAATTTTESSTTTTISSPTTGSATGATTLPNTSANETSGTVIALLTASTLLVLGLVTYSIVNKKNLISNQ